ncbi:MAG: hypothetical protein AAF514_24265, partial [Verrucomicrobiota bacterium]
MSQTLFSISITCALLLASNLSSTGQAPPQLEERIRTFKRIAASGLNASRTFSIGNQADEFRKNMTEDGLADALVSRFKPKNEKSVREIALYGFAFEMVGRNEEAITNYQTALTIRPAYDVVRLRLLPLLSEKDPPSAGELLAKMTGRELSRVGSFLRQQVYQNNGTFDSIEASYGLLFIYLEQMKKTDRVNLRWVGPLIDSLAGLTSIDEITMPPLYASTPGEELNPDHRETRDTLLTRRRELHDRLCQTMIAIPQLSYDGFRRFAGLNLQDGKPVDELRDLALRSLSVQNYDRLPEGFPMDPDEIRLPLPGELLIQAAWQEKAPERLDRELYPALKKEERMLNRLKAYAGLYFCEDGGFEKAARQFLESHHTSEEALARDESLHQLVSAWIEKAPGEGLEPVLIDTLKARKEARILPSGRFLIPYLNHLQKDKNGTDLEPFLNRINEVYLGPEDGREVASTDEADQINS